MCERVDEVDCTKSEKFYSLNLELYGSTAPPIIQPEQTKPQGMPTEQSVQQAKPSQEPDPSLDESPTTTQDKPQEHSTDAIDSTEDPIQEIKKEDSKKQHNTPTYASLPFSEQDDIGNFNKISIATYIFFSNSDF